MLVADIIALAEAQADESYGPQDWVDLFNLCQDELTPLAKMLTTKAGIVVTVTSGKAEITIASDTDLVTAHRILNVYYTPTITGGKEVQLRRLQAFDSASKGWKLDGAKLYIQGLSTETAGTVRADFYKKLAHVVYVASPESYTPTTPEIPEEFHDLYVAYLCYKCQQREEEPEDEADFKGEYKTRKEEFAVARIAQMEPWNLKYLQQGGGS